MHKCFQLFLWLTLNFPNLCASTYIYTTNGGVAPAVHLWIVAQCGGMAAGLGQYCWRIAWFLNDNNGLTQQSRQSLVIDYHLTPPATVKKTTISKWYPVSSGGAYPIPYYIWSIVLVLFSYPVTIPEQTMTELGTKQEQIYHPEKTSMKTTVWLGVLTASPPLASFQLSPETTRCHGRQPSGLTAPAQVARVMKVRMTRCQGRQSLTKVQACKA